MDLTDALILGAVQGITEWLPVSSEGMTSLLMVNFLGKSLSEAVPLAVWLHLGTVLAAALFLREDLKALLSGLSRSLRQKDFSSREGRILVFLGVSTFLTGLFGAPILFFSLGELDLRGEAATAFIGILLIGTGLVQRATGSGTRRASEIGLADGLWAGFFQAFSALPGFSRSGLTVSALLFRRFDSEVALRLSFLMSIPAVLGANVGLGLLREGVELSAGALAGVGAAFVLGYLTLGVLFKVGREFPFWKFCVGFGLLGLLPLLL